jgi:hypothetical protein
VALNRVIPLLGDRPVDEITTADVNRRIRLRASTTKTRKARIRKRAPMTAKNRERQARAALDERD